MAQGPTKRFSMRMGTDRDKSYIDVSAWVWVIPDGAKKLAPAEKHRHPGFSLFSFDANLNPRHVDVKAGTEGQIIIEVDVDYFFIKRYSDSFWTGSVMDEHEKKGYVTGKGIWNYTCTKEGVLSLDHYVPNHSATAAGNFWVTVSDPAEAKENPQAGLPYVMIRSWAHYEDDSPASGIDVPFIGNRFGGPDSPKIDKELLPALIASLIISDKYVPPPPPKPVSPTPKLPVAPLSAVIPFAKEGQTSLDSHAKRIATDWAQALFKTHPELEVPMMKGEIPVYFEGYASKTPPQGEKDEQKADDFNIGIGNGRAQSVIQYLIPSPLGSGAKAYFKSLGRKNAQWALVFDEKLKLVVEAVGKPRGIDRVVIVWVDHDEVKAILNHTPAARPAPPPPTSLPERRAVPARR